ncbi:MAG: 2-amino-4-hydroxy-6-hydroxymethyldihydropteridine diphosphokinase [Bryobacterales bacterium]|nr:2-amino-4-hydroxy-6-hydroxymethyldihydropteridine diphosphokinase [Bryobacterales bacterium]
MKTAYLSLGSNLGNRAQNLNTALELLEQPRVHVTRRSSLYETEPQDLRHQPWFYNIVVEVETALFPLQLLNATQRIETRMGRQRLIPKGPRIIDIDLLLWGSFIIQTPKLQVPHPRMLDRRFVLEPLLELAPALRHPVTKQPLSSALAALRGQAIKRVPIEAAD